MKIESLLAITLLTNISFADSENILLGKKAVYSLEPNYKLSKGNDEYDLTDGNFGDIKLLNNIVSPWTKKNTVAWMMKRKSGVMINFDLKTNKFIGKVNFGAHSGGGVVMPLAIFIYVSKDKKNWNYHGNLINKVALQTNGLVSHMYSLKGLNAHGRYLAFYVVSGGLYLNLDEIEVYSWKKTSINKSTVLTNIISIEDDIKNRLPLIKQRITSLAFIEAARKIIARGGGDFSAPYKRQLNILESMAERQIDILVESDEEFGPPYTKLDRDVAKLVGSYFKRKSGNDVEMGLVTDDMWRNHYNPFARTNTSTSKTMKIYMAKNEIEPLAVSISNNLKEQLKLTIKIDITSVEGKRKWPVNGVDFYLSTHVVASNLGFYDDALQPVVKNLGIEPGITRQLWAFFDSTGVKSGQYKGKLIISNNLTPVQTFDVEIKVYPVDLDYSSVHKSISWAYLSKGRVSDDFKIDHTHALDRSHNTVQVLLNEQIPWPKINPLTKEFLDPMELDFVEFDNMHELRPEVELWLIWANMRHETRRSLNYFGAKNPPKLNSKEHKKFIKKWVRLIKEHMFERGLNNENYAFYWFDESSENSGFLDVVVPYSRWAKEVDVTIKTFATHRMNPIFLSKFPDVIDIHCIPTGDIQTNMVYKQYIERNPYKKFWHYRTDNLKQREPHNDFRLHHTYTFMNGLSGAGFWVWVDNGGQWRDQLASFPGQGMIYKGKNGPVTGKRLEAWREGIEDVALWNAYANVKRKSDKQAYFDLKKIINNSVMRVSKKNRLKGEYIDLQNTRIRVLEKMRENVTVSP